MVTLAHISDLHFGRENPRLVEGLLHALEDIEPQLVVISGDLTQRARTREFLAARAFLDSLRWPFLVIAGNHDISADNLPERFFTPWKKWHRYIANTLEPRVSDKNSIIIGVNTVRRSGYYLDWSRGRVNSRQIAAIAEYLAKEAGERLRVIAAHHPFSIPKQYRYRHVIGGRDMAISSLKKAGVDIILSGHVHLAYTHVLDGLIVSHAGTAISNRLEADFPNSFKIVRGDRRKLSIETREWRSTYFTTTAAQIFVRIQGEWMASDRETFPS